MSSLLLHLLHWKGSAASAGARLVEQSVFDDLAEEPIEHLSGDLTRVCGGFGKFVLWLFIGSIITEDIGAPPEVVIPDLKFVREVVNLEIEVINSEIKQDEVF